VANRAEGSVSGFTIQGPTVAPSSVVRLGDDKSGPSQPAFTRDGRAALVTRDGDSFISVLSVDGTKVEHSKRDLSAGLRPYGLDDHLNPGPTARSRWWRTSGAARATATR
jgi:hypothetical protein